MDKLRKVIALTLAMAVLGMSGMSALAGDIDTDVSGGDAGPDTTPSGGGGGGGASHSTASDSVHVTFETDEADGTFEDGETEIEISVSEGGTISESRVPDVFPTEGNDFAGWIVENDENAEIIDFNDFHVNEDTTLIAVYEILDEMIPFAETPWLNTADHTAYIVGYAEDGTVRPNANITRAEVATIFFRLLTDEARNTMWSTTNTFNDVSADAWYNTAVSTMAEGGIIKGDENGNFRPNANITRAEFAAIASRFMASVEASENQFKDTENHWACEAINAAAEAGWVNGYEDGTFRPNNAITRAEAMTLVNNVLGRKPDADHMLPSMKTWMDNPTSAWYYEAIQEATNSHDYDMGDEYETWTALQENADWAELEKQWAEQHAAGTEGVN